MFFICFHLHLRLDSGDIAAVLMFDSYSDDVEFPGVLLGNASVVKSDDLQAKPACLAVTVKMQLLQLLLLLLLLQLLQFNCSNM